MSNKRKREDSEKSAMQELNDLVENCFEIQQKFIVKEESSSLDLNLSSSTSNYDSLKFTQPILNSTEELNEFSESDNEIESNTPEVQEIVDLRAWVVDNNIPHKYVDKLIPILKRRLLPEIPRTTKSLLKYLKRSWRDELIEIIPTDDMFDLESICKTDFELHLMREHANTKNDIAYIKAKVEKIINTQNEILNYLMMDKKIVPVTETIDFNGKYKYSFPLTTIEMFQQFDTELTTNRLLQTDLIVQFKDFCDSNFVITKSLTKILKFLLTKELASKFTAMRSARNQKDERSLRFISTKIYSIMCAVIKHHRSKKSIETTDKMLVKAISEVICNVKQWT